MEISIEEGANVEYTIREIFHDFFPSENGDLRFSDTKRHPGKEHVDDYRTAVDEIEKVENWIHEARMKHEKGLEKILRNSRAGELIRLKRRPIYESFETWITAKYPLLESDDLLPDREERDSDFRLNGAGKEAGKKVSAIKSDDSLFKLPEIPLLPERMKEAFGEQQNFEIDASSLSRVNNARKTAKPRRSIIKTEQQKTVLVASPSCAEFKNFQPRKIYKRSIVITNVSNAVAKFQAEPLSAGSKFSMVIQSRSGDRENLAPGMNVKMMASFCSDDMDDYEERIVFRVHNGKDVCIVLRASRETPILMGTSYRLMNFDKSDMEKEDDLSSTKIFGSCRSSSSENSWNFGRGDSSLSSSDSSESRDNSHAESSGSSGICGPLSFGQFECGKCFVGERIMVVTRLENVGGDGRFFAMSEIDWNSMSIDDVTTRNFIVLSCFAMWPVYFALKKGERVDLVTYFCPDTHGLQVDKLYVLCDNLAVHPIELIGDGIMYDPNFMNISKIEKEAEEVTGEDTFHHIVNLGSELRDGFLKDTITITNSSNFEIYYRWRKHFPSATNERREGLKSWSDLPLDLLRVRPNSGIFPPCTSIIFHVSVRLTNLSNHLYRAVLQLILIDIPRSAIPSDCENSIENCTNRRRFCDSSVDLRAKEIQVLAQCTGTLDPESLHSSDVMYEIMEDGSKLL